ncbi:MAG: radical SAM protein [Deltaproteobacteria bacterium]|nr:radical SAM protein [Deltaproteobacteria bacterium]
MTATERAAARLAGARDGVLRAGPELIHIDVTNACNLDCTPCWNYSPLLDSPRSPRWKRGRLDDAVFHRAMAGATRLGCERVIFSGGGEPFLHPGIYDFLGAAKARGFHVTSITNGTLVDWSRVSAVGVDRLLLNTCGASDETYVAYHPNQPRGAFAALMRNAARVAGRVRINTVQVITRQNYFELVEMIELAHRIGAARVSFKLVSVSQGTERLAPTDVERQELRETLIPRARARAAALKVRANLDTFASQLAGESGAAFPIEEIGCHAGFYYSRIYLDGRVFYCCEHFEVGDLRVAEFDEIWWSAAYERFRAKMRRGEFLPACHRCGKYDLNFSVAKELVRVQNVSDADLQNP